VVVAVEICDTLSVIPGARPLGREPGIHRAAQPVDEWVRDFVAPGMTEVDRMVAMAIAKRIPAGLDEPINLSSRVDALDWPQITAELDSQGCAVLNGLLTPDQCRAITALYPDDSHFRSRVVTASVAASTNISPIRCRI
jgi:hypothetical protein